MQAHQPPAYPDAIRVATPAADPERRRAHWQNTYLAKADEQVSWFQDDPEPSSTLIAGVAGSTAAPIIDVGGGSSRLVDDLVRRGYRDLTVLDLSAAALDRARARLGPAAGGVEWIAADITEWTPRRRYAVWHDRATFHFLVTEADRAAYLARLAEALTPGGHAIIATFAPDGPATCSGLPVMRYDAEGLGRTLGPAFRLVNAQRHLHRTPWGVPQAFQFAVFRCDGTP
jgi:SAM-dependent methyltransferase